MQKRLDYSFNGYQVPRASRSPRVSKLLSSSTFPTDLYYDMKH